MGSLVVKAMNAQTNEQHGEQRDERQSARRSERRGEQREAKLEYFARCASGFERVLADELRGLRLRQVRPLKGGVAFFGTLEDGLRACLWSRVATRVQLVLARVGARDASALYRAAVSFPWEEHVREGATIAVAAHGTNAQLRNTQFTALKVKDAVCDRLRELQGERPDVDAADPDFSIDVSVHADRATIALSLSGASLHRRGYREDRQQTEAPLKETLAAGMLLAAGWPEIAQAGGAFIDPMCGSGTLAIEAALVLADRAPGLLREKWGFEGWRGYDPAVWEQLRDQAKARAEAGSASVVAAASDAAASRAMPRIIASDNDARALHLAKANAKRAGVADFISFDLANAAKLATRLSALRRSEERPLCRSGKPSGEKAYPTTLGPGDPLPALLPQVDRGNTSSQGGEEGSHQVTPNGAQGLPEQDAATASLATTGLLATNPPYGKRLLANGGLVAAYEALSQAVDALPEGWQLAVITPDASLDTALGMVPHEVLACYNGPLEVGVRLYTVQPTGRVRVPVTSLAGVERQVAVAERTSEQFAARLRKVARERVKWARQEGVSCYRLYDSDLPEYALAIDLYEGAAANEGERFVRVAEYQAPSSVDPERAARRFSDAMALIPAVLDVPAANVFAKVRQRDKGGQQYTQARDESCVVQVQEAGYVFEVDLGGYLDTGLFLDHRITRELVGEMAKGTRFLNLFAYTGTATVYAAGADAAETTTVDLSNTYLDWAYRNMASNRLVGDWDRFVRADTLRWLREEARYGAEYDLVFCDPPTFSNSKSMGGKSFEVQRDHVGLLTAVADVLALDGTIVFSCNKRNFKLDEQALADYGLVSEDITPRTIPHDFSRTPKVHRCYLIRWRG